MYNEDLALNNLQWLICRKSIEKATITHGGRVE